MHETFAMYGHAAAPRAGNASRPLRVLHVNKFHFLNGGAELYYFELMDLLAAHGHTVGHFSMHHRENVFSGQARYFVRNVDYANPRGFVDRLQMAGRTIYSLEARRNIAQLLHDQSYQIAHIHNYCHQISPSILPEFKKRGIPVVYTMQDLKILCPNQRMLTHDGVCERCKGRKFYNCTLHCCTKGSYAASLVNSIEMYFHYWMGYFNLFDRMLTPSRFYGQKLVEYGFPPDKIGYVPNFVHVERYEPEYAPGDYFLYLGRLSPEKGVLTLIEAMKQFPKVRLKIAGRGDSEEDIRRTFRESTVSNLELTGHLSGGELRNTIRGAMAVIIPSEWYENCPLALIESYACGKPVIAADIAGLGEMVVEGETGLKFESGDVADLVRVLDAALEDRGRLAEMGRKARQVAEQEYDAPQQYETIMAVYSGLLPKSCESAS